LVLFVYVFVLEFLGERRRRGYAIFHGSLWTTSRSFNSLNIPGELSARSLFLEWDNDIKKPTRGMKQLLLEFREFVKIGAPGAGQKISIWKNSSVTLILTVRPLSFSLFGHSLILTVHRCAGWEKRWFLSSLFLV
jgi:hypothetical protein